MRKIMTSRVDSTQIDSTWLVFLKVDSSQGEEAGRAVSEIAHKCARGLTTCWPVVSTGTFKRRSFARDGSEIVHKCRNCLATCYDSTGVSRGRPNCLQMSSQKKASWFSNKIQQYRECSTALLQCLSTIERHTRFGNGRWPKRVFS